MTKRLLIALIALSLGAHVTGCTSGGSKGDSDVAEANDETFAEESEGDFAEESNADGASEEAAPADGESADSSVADAGEHGGDEELSLEEGGEATSEAKTESAPAEGGDELAVDDPDSALPDDVASKGAEAGDGQQAAESPPPTDEPLFNAEPPTSTADTSPPVIEELPPADNSTASSEMPAESSPIADTPVAAPVAYLPLLKVKDSAFEKNGTLLNRVYVGRPGDKVKTVSQMIYGTPDRARDLTTWNPFLKRGVRTGDKIYYASPTNPNDNRMLVYYEEIGAQPQVHVTKEGENIRPLAKSLLGFNDAWKEVWATNMQVESKGNLPPGIELRYWPEGSAQAAPPITQAGNSETPAQPSAPPDKAPVDPMAPPVAEAPPQDPGFPQAGATDPTAAPPVNQASTDGNQPPTDPLAPPPPPPPLEPPTQQAEAKPVKPEVIEEAPTGPDEDTMMAIAIGGAGLVLAIAMLAVYIRRSKKRKSMEFGQTQV